VVGPEKLIFSICQQKNFLEGVVAVRVSEQMAKNLGLRDNQVIRGVLEDRGGLLKLMFNNYELDWPANKRFKAGDRVDFRYESSVYGRSLRPISQPPTSPSTATPITALAGASPRLLSLLYRPDQPSLLSQLFKPGGLELLLSQAPNLPVQQGLGQFGQSMSMLSADAVKNALLNSGLFGEYFLASQSPPRPDLKQLLRNLLRNMPLQAAAAVDIEMAIDEIESRQLDSLQAQQNRELSYHFLLPFGDAHPVEVHLERGAYSAEQDDPDWVINLHTDSDMLGELWLKTTLKAASSLEMVMWVQRSDVAQLAQTARTELEYELQAFGLQLTKLSILNASRPSLDADLTGPGQVLDVRT